MLNFLRIFLGTLIALCTHCISVENAREEALSFGSFEAAKEAFEGCKRTSQKCETEEYGCAVWKKTRTSSENAVKGTKKQLKSREMTDFATLFVDFELTNRIGLFNGEVWDQEHVEQLKECVRSSDEKIVRWKEGCKQEEVDMWRIPAFAMNNYFVRLPEDMEFNADEGFIDYKQHWPASRTLQADQTIGVVSCPNALHGLLTVQEGGATVRVYEPEVLPQLQPHFSAAPHILDYGANVWNDEPGTEAFSEIEMVGEGMTLYIPPGHAYAVRASSEGTLLTEFCFLDAANLNAFREAIAVEALMSPYARTVKQLFTAGVHVDLHMERDVADSTFSIYNIWPRPLNIESLSREQPQDGAPARNRRDKKTFRGWQDRARWDSITRGLTFPLLDAPTIGETGRDHAELHWLSNYKPRSDDSTPAGYEITVEDRNNIQSEFIATATARLLLQDLVETPDIAQSAQEMQPVFRYRGIVPKLKPNTEYRFRVAVFYDESRGHPSGPSTSAMTLPLTPPVGAATNITIATDTIGLTSVTLSFNPPDDGGLPILGFHVFAQRQDDRTHAEWQFLGNFNISAKISWHARQDPKDELQLLNLLPDTTYRFKLTAFNELGDSASQVLSPQVRTLKVPEGESQKPGADHIHGVGHPSHHGQSDSDYVSTSGLVTVVDRSQKVVAGNQTFEVWSCHWSPRSFRVSAETVWVQPSMVEGAITNTNEIRGRIALVRRGNVPFVSKVIAVQAAGGLGVIILDDGRCKTFDQACLPGAQRHKSELFAQKDMRKPWQSLKIPVVFMLHTTGETFILHAQLVTPEATQRLNHHHEEL